MLRYQVIHDLPIHRYGRAGVGWNEIARGWVVWAAALTNTTGAIIIGEGNLIMDMAVGVARRWIDQDCYH